MDLMDGPPEIPDLNLIKLICGDLENKLDRSLVHSKESLGLQLQRVLMFSGDILTLCHEDELL